MMLCQSKLGYRKIYPANVPVFNSNLAIETDAGPLKVWYGDVDLTVDLKKLTEVSKKYETDIFIS